MEGCEAGLKLREAKEQERGSAMRKAYPNRTVGSKKEQVAKDSERKWRTVERGEETK